MVVVAVPWPAKSQKGVKQPISSQNIVFFMNKLKIIVKQQAHDSMVMNYTPDQCAK